MFQPSTPLYPVLERKLDCNCLASLLTCNSMAHEHHLVSWVSPAPNKLEIIPFSSLPTILEREANQKEEFA